MPRPREARQDNLIRPYTDAIRDVLQTKEVEYNGSNIRPGEVLYTLSGNEARKAEADGEYTAVPIPQDVSRHWWLASTVRWSFTKGQPYLKAVCLIVFYGQPLGAMLPILRAEWDDYSDQAHAQPHWHAYVEPQEVEPVAPTYLGGAQEFTGAQREVSRTSLVRFADIHYAMAARWHSASTGGQCTTLSQEASINWLRGCLTYLICELLYVTPTPI